MLQFGVIIWQGKMQVQRRWVVQLLICLKCQRGGAKGVDPGFHKQMNELEEVLQSVSGAEGGSDNDVIEKGVQEGIITKEQADSLRALMKK
mmetsp:Transcript_39589/g.59889  ORF Transcript_39589/g.59889 Transcript_39589/m.59889 type:complete len:91 (+) Transcript_39589:151-423(+)